MRKTTFKLIALFALANGLVYGQTTNSFTVGDTLTTATIERITGYNPQKAMILDFGTTTCPPCIQSLKELDFLQQQFDEDLQAFFVTKEPQETVEKFLTHNATVKGNRIPVISADTTLHATFPHISQPHVVWIDKEGVVKAITDRQYVHEETIQQLINGEDFPDWQVKQEHAYDYQRRILELNSQNFNGKTAPSRWQSSFISNQMPGVFFRQHTYVDSAEQKVVVSAINISIASMYVSLYGLETDLSFFPSHMVLDVADPQKYYYQYNEHSPYLLEWKKQNTYCYEMTFPLALTKAERTKRIIQQLNWYFGIEVEMKAVKRDCWIIKADDPVRIDAKQSPDVVENTGIRLSQFHYQVNQIANHVPVINEVDKDAGIDRGRLINITDAAYDDLELLKEQLAPYGLTVKVEERKIETLFIKELR